MPAAAVIPAPIAYIKVVAVKKLVVELWNGGRGFFDPEDKEKGFPLFPLRAPSLVRRRSAPKGRALARAFPPTGRSLLLFVEWEYSSEELPFRDLGFETGSGVSASLARGFARAEGVSKRSSFSEGGFFFSPFLRFS